MSDPATSFANKPMEGTAPDRDPLANGPAPGEAPDTDEGTIDLPIGGASSGEATVVMGQPIDGTSHPTRPTLDFRAAERTSPAVPGYEILGELGRGGMGVVYKAREARLNRLCALKMILAGAHFSREALARFLTEATSVARLSHSNIVQVHHTGEYDGLPFIELEYTAGGSLDKRLDGTPWNPRLAAELIEPLARAVAEAHRAGIVHRDLKPGNILLDNAGVAKVSDFGLAKALGSESGLTATESVLGTPSYMAPEQAEGHARDVGPAADVYSLGAIFYELLTGRPPFKGASLLETLQQVRSAEPVPPGRLVPGLPRDAETIALKCLQKGPGQRYGTASELADDLRRFLSDEPIMARPVPAWERALKLARRRPALSALFVPQGDRAGPQ
ncbi:hypothetical protein BH23PLA1_BH23PLA1_03000 [soil metagenome]